MYASGLRSWRIASMGSGRQKSTIRSSTIFLMRRGWWSSSCVTPITESAPVAISFSSAASMSSEVRMGFVHGRSITYS